MTAYRPPPPAAAHSLAIAVPVWPRVPYSSRTRVGVLQKTSKNATSFEGIHMWDDLQAPNPEQVKKLEVLDMPGTV